jgi:HEPN domain-containing protein
MNANLDPAKEWVLRARNDLLNADNNLASAKVPFDTVCFHCQQAAEKLLKAFLVAQAQPAPRTHDLLLLLEGVVRLRADAEGIRDSLVVLQPYAIEARYPDAGFMPSGGDAREARAAAAEVAGWFERALPEAG